MNLDEHRALHETIRVAIEEDEPTLTRTYLDLFMLVTVNTFGDNHVSDADGNWFTDDSTPEENKYGYFYV
jgi:hypothetical protein